MTFLHRWRPPLWAVCVAAVCGPLTALGFPPHDVWWLTPLGMAVLLSLCWLLPPRRAAMAAWVFCLGCAMVMVWWLTVVMTLHGGLSQPAAWAIVALCMAVLTLYPTAAVALIAYCRQAGLSPLLVAPLAWAGSEWLRGVLFTGFPWLPMPSGLAGRLELVQTVEWWGVSGLSAWLVLVAALLARAALPLAAKQRPGRRELAALAAAVIILAVGWLWGQQRMSQVAAEMEAAPKLRVSVVQGDVAIERLWRPEQRQAIIAAQASLSRQADGPGRPWLIVWPESSTPYYFGYEEPGTQELQALARELNAFVMPAALGVTRRQGANMTTNRAWLIGPDGGLIGYYDKAHLVPFGEYVPLGELLFWVRAIAQIGGDQAAGRPGVHLKAGDVNIGPLICYESIFPYLARAQRLGGATVLVNQTNDAWYGRSGASAQHMSHLIFRCVENRMACARAANTGISCFVLPDGRQTDQTGLFEPAQRTAMLPLAGETTFFTRHGEIVGPVGAGALAVFWALAWARMRRTKRKDKHV